MDEPITTAVREPDFRIFTGILKAAESDGRKTLHGTASSTIKDLHRDEMRPSAIDDMVRSANNNLTIFLNHSYEVPEDVAGSVTRATKQLRSDAGLSVLDLDLDIDINEENPRAVQTWKAIKAGTKLGLSIGAFIPDGGATRKKDEGGWIIEHVDLKETSIVGIPANPRSWVEWAVKSLNGRGADFIEKKPFSGHERHDLPDSAFACPEKRLYPHHTASGAVDKPHLRAALSRVGDASNDQCGKAHLEAHAKSLGMGDRGKKAIDLALINTTSTTNTAVDFVDVTTFGSTSKVYVPLGDSAFLEAITDNFDVAHFMTAAASDDDEDTHEHPHAHEHTHDHEHYGGIKHSHEHAHTHAHEHGDDHEHVDDKQGYEHDHSHVGSYDPDHAHEEDEKDAEKGLTGVELEKHLDEFDVQQIAKTTVKVETPSATVTVDTGRSNPATANPTPQDAQSSTPDNGLRDETADGDDAALGDTVTRSRLIGLLTRQAEITRELITAKEELLKTKAALTKAEEERDLAKTERNAVLAGTKQVLDKLANAPLMRRTVVADAQISLADQFGGIYSEDFLKIVEKK